ncbi:hypothetical protein DRE_01390 [Drechslerella stenobrocha 248]|uniref:Inhibitor of growth protein N-terminal histone-binding domain-containing protein n=1 Tax=Drechslerella stenobrocha 248 TaxID=1043628 RepID=W7HVX5_9PEZI|nr:hypothetical protein DRE_01390 [Drechslerella stenobrocha 248]
MDIDIVPFESTSHDINPDASSVVSEYIDYTEYLHCDIARSLSLINKLDSDYTKCAAAVHEVASDYCALVEADPATDDIGIDIAGLERVRELRQGIANPLNAGLADREESVAEAARLYETVDRHFNRLSDIIRRLQKITVIPRQPLPQDKTQDHGASKQSDSQMRITLRSITSSSARYTNARTPVVPMKTLASARKRAASRFTDEKSTHRIADHTPKAHVSKASSSYIHIPQPLEPDSSDESDWDTAPTPPAFISDVDRKSSLTHCYTEDDRRLPWFELQPQELAVLRKRMKKNSSWQPSDAMMLKQLEMLGRGVRGFRKWARRTGQSKADVDRILEGGEGLPGGLAIGALKRSQDNKGMRLNVMKRAKREREKAEAAAAAAAQTIEGPGGNDKAKMEAISRSRAGARRTSIQAIDAPSAPEERSPIASAGQSNKIKSETTSKKPPHTDANAHTDKTPSQPPLSSRKLRKPLTSGGEDGMAGQNNAYCDDGDDMPIDPNEPTYCLCNRVGFGTMVGCDNDDVRFPS